MRLKNEIEALGVEFTPAMFSGSVALYAPLQPESDALIEGDLAYGSHERHRLDVYGLDGEGGRDKPVVVFVHGGGFVAGNKRMEGAPFWANVGNWAARAGFVGVTMNYRLAPAHRWPSGAEDVGRAVDWLAENIQRYGGSPERIVLMGQSAGATHVADYVALCESGRLSAQKNGVAAAIMISGVYDLAGSEVNSFLEAYCGSLTERNAVDAAAAMLARSGIPLLYTVSELDPENFQAQAALLKAAYGDSRKENPRIIHLRGHNHISSVLQIGSHLDDLGPVLEEFIKEL